ncbi:MAG: flagellar hook-associated protein 3 [Pseudomonadota bacterium]|jgi:flagellar hook-associated protein 3 FlgL
MSFYRVGTAHSYDNTISRISQRTVALTEAQEKLAAGKRVLRATDDPVSATLAEREQNRLLRVQADMRGLERSRSALQLAESATGDAVDLMQRIKELVVQAGNTVLSAGDRQSIASELRGLRSQLLDVANTKDSEGQALFGGLGTLATSGTPFADVYNASPAVQYQAIAGQNAATENTLPARSDGDFAFMRNLTGNGTFVVSHVTGDAIASTGSVVGTPNANVLPYDPDPTVTAQGFYTVDFALDASVPARLTMQVNRTDKVPPGAGAAVAVGAPVDLGVYNNEPMDLGGRTLAFEGIQLELDGLAAPGAQVRIDPSETSDLFATVQKAIDVLENPNTTFVGPRVTQELAQVHEELESGLNRLLLVQGRLGEWLRRADGMENAMQNREVDHQTQLSNLTDLDMVKGISDFESQQLGLQAALQSYAQVQKLSLFQYIA